MEALQYVFYLLLTLGVLVTVHEYGHYVVARASGVRILRFSVGFGRALHTWTDRRGTDFTIAAIPLGGYLKMLEASDRPEGAEAKDLAFDELSPAWRIAIAVAGPAANFLLAFVVYAFIAMMGVTAFLPVIGGVQDGSPAANAGLAPGQELVRVDGRPTETWMDVGMGLAARLGDTGDIDLEARWPGQTTTRNYAIPVDAWQEAEDEPDLLGSIGISAELPALVGEVLPESAAQAAGFMPWDRVVAVDGAPITTWRDWVEAVRGAPGETLQVRVSRNGETAELTLVPAAAEANDGSAVGFAGVGAATRTVRSGPVGAIAAGARETVANTQLTLNLLRKMVLGLVSPKNLSGPIMIAKVAKDSAESGWRNFLGILALLSISLGVINLLPIPILDGGHILFGVAELVTRRPVSAQVQAVGLRMGLLVVAGMMVLAIYNDITRFL